MFLIYFQSISSPRAWEIISFEKGNKTSSEGKIANSRGCAWGDVDGGGNK